MTFVGTLRQALTLIDTEHPTGSIYDGQVPNKIEAVRENAIDAALEGASTVCAGTPLALVTGAAQVANGVRKLATGAAEPNGLSPRRLASGAKSIVGGLAAPWPLIGHLVNGTFGTADVLQLANSLAAPPQA